MEMTVVEIIYIYFFTIFFVIQLLFLAIKQNTTNHLKCWTGHCGQNLLLSKNVSKVNV